MRTFRQVLFVHRRFTVVRSTSRAKTYMFTSSVELPLNINWWVCCSIHPHSSRTTIYRRVKDLTYSLKLRESRRFLHSAINKYGLMPFSLRSFDDEKRAKIGVQECESHGLLQPYRVMADREGNFVAEFKCTVLIMPNKIMKITGLPLDMETVKSQQLIEDKTILDILHVSLKLKKSKKTKKKMAKKRMANEENKIGQKESDA